MDVTTIVRRGVRVPVRYRHHVRTGGPMPRMAELTTVMGPDVVSGGGAEGAPYARSYFQCLTRDGALVMLFRDLRASPAPGTRGGGAWYLHGWWD